MSSVPLWLEVAMFARAHRDRFGVVLLERGALARSLNAPNRHVIARAVATAVRHGYLAQGSNTTCLKPTPVPCPCGCNPAYHEVGVHAPGVRA